MHLGVVIPAFNAGRWVGDAMASVLLQSHRHWSLVVVDDGSTDGTGDVVERFVDPRIRLVHQANAGVSAARNAGLASLSSDAVLFLDADDWLAPDALARLAAALDATPDAVAVGGPYVIAGRTTVRQSPAGDLLPRLLVRNLFSNGGHVLVRATAIRRVGGFRVNIAYGEDWEFWIRIALLGPFAASRGAPVLIVRQHEQGAYQRMAADPASFAPCMEAIFSNPALLTRFGEQRLSAIRRRTEAENAWIIGRELIRHGESRCGRRWLRRAVLSCPSLKRAVLLATSHLLPVLPAAAQGPFRPYRVRTAAPSHARHPAPGC